MQMDGEIAQKGFNRKMQNRENLRREQKQRRYLRRN